VCFALTEACSALRCRQGIAAASATELRIGSQAVKLAVEPSGLRTVEVLEVPPYPYAAIFEKPEPDS
jgi:hypothetical protein